MKYLLFILLTTFCLSSAFAQNTEKEIIDQFFTLYDDNPTAALDYIYNTTPWVDSQGDGVKSLKGKLENLIELIGSYNGKEFIADATLGECFSMFVYLVKYDRQPLRFTFKFYKPNDKWILYSFSYDDSIDDDLEEVIKYRYLDGGN
jgi:hypothetical protein